ncbi:cellulase family glycosylhydrolase [Wenyingzhuangia sp. chi5]|uniref:Exo-1,3-beta-glucanase D n=1 Tax=Wenyingzhuangia gilva TaxID=3057677 RepID=A0ABT8VQR0_9FLAO|nr:cellulase family glycosylhydrolase [Wenyingzhuangia sp. chi5]MDO3694305.1 cellulase family glycosylhydrolase [Wenyingzhuangia sp. chi5]
MKKYYQFCRLFLLFLTSVTYGQMTSADFLKTDGTVLRNQNGLGDTITLRGTNLGAWLSMEYWMGPVGKGSLNRSQWVASASSTYSGTNVQNVFDRDLNSRWSSGAAQLPDESQYFMVDMQEQVLFNRISFEARGYTGDYPRGYRIEVSDDQLNWEEVTSGTGTSEDIFVQLPNIYHKRYVKIVQTGTANSNFWSIAEFNLFMEDDYTVRNSLYDRFGADMADTILDSFQEAWITSSDLDNIQSMGMNMVRVPFYWMEIMYNDGTIKPHGFDQLDWVINECNDRNMYVILDLHGAPGGINGFITSGQAVINNYWTDQNSQNMTIDIWKAIATRYKDNPTVAMYDLLNEPLSSDQSNYPIHQFYNDLYNEVRQIDPDHTISIGAFPGFSFVVAPQHYGWTNVVYQVHHYNEDKTNWTSQDGFIDAVLLDVANHMHNWNVPVLAGEFNLWNFPDLWQKYISGLNALNASWSNWAYKVKRIDNPVENWGYYDGYPGEIPDIHYDTAEVISQKWSQYVTPNFRENTNHINNISPLTQATISVAPIGMNIWIKGNNLKYLSSEGNDNPMTCIKTEQNAWEVFKVVDAGNGKIALLGSNDKYVNAGDGTGSMYCNADAIGETEKFTFIQLGENKFALKSNVGFYLSSENGVNPVISNRQTIGGWELFTWGDATENTVSKTTEFEIYPNPASNEVSVIVENAEKNYNLKVYDTTSRLIVALNKVKDKVDIDVSSFSSGLYFFHLTNSNEKFIKKIFIN